METGVGKELSYPKTYGTKTMEKDAKTTDKSDKLFAALRFMGKDQGILMTDLQEASLADEFVLTDAEGAPLTLYSCVWWGVNFDQTQFKFESFDEQEGFTLYYLLPNGVTIDELTLVVAPEAGSSLTQGFVSHH